jgi:hypothetical protein
MGKGVGVGEFTMVDSTAGTTVTSPTYPNPTAVTIKMAAVRARCNHVSHVVLTIAFFPDLPDLPDPLMLCPLGSLGRHISAESSAGRSYPLVPTRNRCDSADPDRSFIPDPVLNQIVPDRPSACCQVAPAGGFFVLVHKIT